MLSCGLLGGEAPRGGVDLGGQHRLLMGDRAQLEPALGGGERACRRLRELRRPLARRGARIVLDAVEQAEAERLLGLDPAPGEQQLLGPQETHHRRQPRRDPAGDRVAERDLGEAHPQVPLAHDQIGGQRQLGAAADGIALDRRDEHRRSAGEQRA